MKIKRIDSLVIYTKNLERSARFYHEVFDLALVNQTPTTKTFKLGQQLLVLSLAKEELLPQNPSVGSCAFSIVSADQPSAILNHLKSYFVSIVKVNEQATGAFGPCFAVTIKDPDENLIEIVHYAN
ncbi:VOC family protein [Ligilactobacillus sp. Marseille-Q7487]|jgi:catechol 2,3-dioxygenase-like lactoylglutathione lyase family enzyme|uniref:VOC family protein n=1 Tax=Ligilactobacillus sp. Marseille-Q7487 TaxID=3022128 RepID=UPI0015B3C4A5|nr:VOC family protein [Ligilactobacillus sp. Marseille-Q7487]